MKESGDCVFARFEEYKDKIPELCHTMQQYYVTWISPNYYMSLAAVIYRYSPLLMLWKMGNFCRFVLLKYADRGLVNDRYYYNMNMSLFNVLFWLSNIVLFTINQGIVWVHVFKHGTSLFQNAHKY